MAVRERERDVMFRQQFDPAGVREGWIIFMGVLLYEGV